MTSKLWILTAWHKDEGVESLFLLNDDSLKLAGFDPDGEIATSDLMAHYFGGRFEGGSIVEAEVVVGRPGSLPLELELRVV